MESTPQELNQERIRPSEQSIAPLTRVTVKNDYLYTVLKEVHVAMEEEKDYEKEFKVWKSEIIGLGDCEYIKKRFRRRFLVWHFLPRMFAFSYVNCFAYVDKANVKFVGNFYAQTMLFTIPLTMFVLFGILLRKGIGWRAELPLQLWWVLSVTNIAALFTIYLPSYLPFPFTLTAGTIQTTTLFSALICSTVVFLATWGEFNENEKRMYWHGLYFPNSMMFAGQLVALGMWNFFCSCDDDLQIAFLSAIAGNSAVLIIGYDRLWTAYRTINSPEKLEAISFKLDYFTGDFSVE